MEGYASTTARAFNPPPISSPEKRSESALSLHATCDAMALDIASRNLDRLKRLRTRLLGVSDLVAGSGAEKAQTPHPDGVVPNLERMAQDMAAVLNETSNLIDQLDKIG